MTRPQNWSTTERDAERYERRFAPDYPDPLDARPDPSDLWEPDLRGEVADEDYGDGPDDLGAVNLGAITAVFLLSLIGTCLFLLAVMGGRSMMCKTHDQGLSYCSGHTAVQK